MQFTKNSTHLLRAISITQRPDGSLKASEPSQKGLELFMATSGDKLEAACKGVAIEAAGGGEWWFDIYELDASEGIDEPLFTRVRTHTNKVAGGEGAIKYVTSQQRSQPAGGRVQSQVTPRDPVAAYHAARAVVEAKEKELAAARVALAKAIANVQSVRKAAAEIEEIEGLEAAEA
jgi:hypothetical protein